MGGGSARLVQSPPCEATSTYPPPTTPLNMSDFEHHNREDEADDSAPLRLENLDTSQLDRVYEMIMDAQRLAGPLSSARYSVVDKLEKVEEASLVKNKLLDERCSICYTPFGALLAEEEMMLAMDTPGASERALGVTRLQRCGHYFCRKDISKWILEGNDLCPYCRAPYLEPAVNAVDPSTTGNNATPASGTPRNTNAGGEQEVDELEAAVRLFESQSQNQWNADDAQRVLFQRLAQAGAGRRHRPAQQTNHSMYS